MADRERGARTVRKESGRPGKSAETRAGRAGAGRPEAKKARAGAGWPEAKKAGAGAGRPEAKKARAGAGWPEAKKARAGAGRLEAKKVRTQAGKAKNARIRKAEVSKVRKNEAETKQAGTRPAEAAKGSAGRIGKAAKPQIKGQYCPVEKSCGGCQLLHLTYQEQLARKQKAVEQLFRGICPVHPITGMEQPLHYRNKVHAVFSHKRDGSIISGTYAAGTHDVVSVDECLLENQKADAIIRDIRALLKSFKIMTYNEDTGYGLFRHALIRTAHHTGEIMVVLVLGSPILPSKNNFVKAFRKLHPEITTIVLNVNDRKTSMVLGERETVLYGKGYIEDELCGCRFRISAKSFYQINSVQTEKLYDKAMELAGLTGSERVIDAYCGIGTIGMVAAKQAGEVIGVELNPDAVRDAVRNAKMNAMKNIQFYQNDAGVFLVQMAEAGEKADVVFMDPPRAGSDEAFLSSAVQLAPKRIVYISCNPETQVRDLAYLKQHGYRAEGVWPYDLFPFTEHVETVCLLSKLNAK